MTHQDTAKKISRLIKRFKLFGKGMSPEENSKFLGKSCYYCLSDSQILEALAIFREELHFDENAFIAGIEVEKNGHNKINFREN